MQENSRALRKFVVESGMPLKKLSEVIEMPAAQVMKWVCNEDVSIPFQKLELLAKYIGTTAGEIVSGNYDVDLVRRRIWLGPLSLPEKYGRYAQSNTRTSAHIIDFLKLYVGQQKADALLAGMGVHPLLFDGLDNKINLNFFCDLLLTVTNLHGVNLTVSKLASLSPIFLKETDFINSFVGCKSYEELYITIMQNIEKFDKNFDYKFTLSEKGLVFQARPSEFLKKIVQEKTWSKANFKVLFLYRKHLLGSYPILIGLEPLPVIAKKSIFGGDQCDEYEIAFPVLNTNVKIFRTPSQQVENFEGP